MHRWSIVVVFVRETLPCSFVVRIELRRTIHQANAGDLITIDIVQLGVEIFLRFRISLGRNLIQDLFRFRAAEPVEVRERCLPEFWNAPAVHGFAESLPWASGRYTRITMQREVEIAILLVGHANG